MSPKHMAIPSRIAVPDRTRIVVTRVLMLIALGETIFIVYQGIGSLALAGLGLLVGVVTLGLQQATDLSGYAMDADESLCAAERAARYAELESTIVPLLVAKLVSASLIVAGLGLFFVVP